MDTIQYKSGQNTIQGANVTTISNTETAIITVIGQSPTGANNPDNQVGFLKGHTQASLGWDYTAGSTTSITFRFYYYRYEVNNNANPYQSVVFLQNGSTGAMTAYPQTLTVLAANAGRCSYDFQLPACDGIKITVQSAGTTTSSTLNEIHLALRTN